MAKASQSHRELRRTTKAASLGSYRFTQDAGYTPQCFPLRGKVITLVHDPTTVSEELLDRIRIVPFCRVTKPEDFTECPTLPSVEGLLVMQSRAYRLYSEAVDSNVPRTCNGQHIISTDSCVWTQSVTSPTVKNRQDRERQRGAHKTSPLHGDTHTILFLADSNGFRNIDNLLPVSFGERRLRILHPMLIAQLDAKGSRSAIHVELGQPCAVQAAENGPYSIMRESVSRLCQISRKILLITTQVACETPNFAIVETPTSKVAHSLVQLTKDRKDCVTAQGTCSKDTCRRDGNDTHLAALLRNWRSNMDRVRVGGEASLTEVAEVLHRQQGSVTLQNFRVLNLVEGPPTHNLEQPVKKGILPGERRATSSRFEDTTLHVDPIKVSMEIFSEQVTKMFVVPAFTPRALPNSILAARRMYPSTFSQLIAEHVNHVIFDRILEQRTRHVVFGDITGVVEQPFRDEDGTSFWKAPCEPGESQDAPRLTSTHPSKPSLNGPGNLLDESDFPLREANVTEGCCKIFQLLANPVSPTRAGSSYPLPNNPATTLLRNTRGHKTSPYRLPNGGMGIDNTPMGLPTTTLCRGVMRGTYYTAKKC
jgi:hypothetical protein